MSLMLSRWFKSGQSVASQDHVTYPLRHATDLLGHVTYLLGHVTHLLGHVTGVVERGGGCDLGASGVEGAELLLRVEVEQAPPCSLSVPSLPLILTDNILLSSLLPPPLLLCSSAPLLLSSPPPLPARAGTWWPWLRMRRRCSCWRDSRCRPSAHTAAQTRHTHSVPAGHAYC
eukprot:2268728-Rhodomonas_salina.1